MRKLERILHQIAQRLRIDLPGAVSSMLLRPALAAGGGRFRYGCRTRQSDDRLTVSCAESNPAGNFAEGGSMHVTVR